MHAAVTEESFSCSLILQRGSTVDECVYLKWQISTKELKRPDEYWEHITWSDVLSSRSSV